MTTDEEIRRVAQALKQAKGPEAIFYGLDVGRVRDYSALAILVRYIMPVDNILQTRYYCVHLKRYPLKTPYEIVESDCHTWWNWADAEGFKKYFTMDMTGVGAPVLEGIRHKGVRVIGISITGGMQETNPDIGQYNVPKSALVSQLIRTTQMGRFKGWAKFIPIWDKFKEELNTFGYEVVPETSTLRYESLKSKIHDDLVTAVALPIWYGERVVPFWMTNRTIEADIEEYDPLAQGV